MKLLIWLLRIVVFVALFGLAIKNDGPIELRFFFDHSTQAPLSLILLAAFAAGAAVGVSAAFATLIRQRLEIGRMRRNAAGTKD
jgi:uncharacterized integral membrane protein